MSNDAVWVRGVTGIQLHHTTDLQDAGRFLGNAAMALRAAHVRTGDDRYSDLATELKAVLILARELEDEARAGLHRLHSTDPETQEYLAKLIDVRRELDIAYAAQTPQGGLR